IASWRRTIHQARSENSTTVLERAAIELWRLAKGSLDATVHQAIMDSLHEMADAAGIDPDEAQLIFLAAKDAPPDHRANGAVPAAAGEPSRPTPAPPLIQSSADFVAGFTPPDYLLDGVLQRGFIYSLTGRTGSGKTTVALYVSASAGLGKTIGNYAIER